MFRFLQLRQCRFLTAPHVYCAMIPCVGSFLFWQSGSCSLSYLIRNMALPGCRHTKAFRQFWIWKSWNPDRKASTVIFLFLDSVLYIYRFLSIAWENFSDSSSLSAAVSVTQCCISVSSFPSALGIITSLIK